MIKLSKMVDLIVYLCKSIFSLVSFYRIMAPDWFLPYTHIMGILLCVQRLAFDCWMLTSFCDKFPVVGFLIGIYTINVLCIWNTLFLFFKSVCEQVKRKFLFRFKYPILHVKNKYSVIDDVWAILWVTFFAKCFVKYVW